MFYLCKHLSAINNKQTNNLSFFTKITHATNLSVSKKMFYHIRVFEKTYTTSLLKAIMQTNNFFLRNIQNGRRTIFI